MKVNDDLSATEKRIADLIIVRSSVGLSDVHKKEQNSLLKQKKDLEKKLNRLQNVQKAQQKFRDNRKKVLEELETSNPAAAKRLKGSGMYFV